MTSLRDKAERDRMRDLHKSSGTVLTMTEWTLLDALDAQDTAHEMERQEQVATMAAWVSHANVMHECGEICRMRVPEDARSLLARAADGDKWRSLERGEPIADAILSGAALVAHHSMRRQRDAALSDAEEACRQRDTLQRRLDAAEKWQELAANAMALVPRCKTVHKLQRDGCDACQTWAMWDEALARLGGRDA